MPLPYTAKQLQAAVHTGFSVALKCSGGSNASYIPYLASVDPNLIAVTIVTVDGNTFAAGDSQYQFAIESISKVFTLALVMDQVGSPALRAKVGANPTGMPFNSVMALELAKGKPMSPLVNAGAISTASLVSGKTPDERWQKILATQSAFAGRDLVLSSEINQSEQTTNFHNRAIAWLLYSAGTCYSDPIEALDIYTRQCSTLISTTDLAVMGATLANKGKNPITGKQVIGAENVRHILAEMMMEGLYTASGDFAYTVGLPGKSGVGGGILAVAPGKLAIAGFSPPLDANGNSVRGQAAVKSIAEELKLNLFEA
ncbi:glutaminase A [Pseudovibrio sp. SPO723]|uniref:glutaminase A n=1 Tax=Nesiotobacter zosterae TaxID=392721 RepID=UPI0029C2A950|nr:glutaminase A [Pseudovibrio sp. SPO723]MDX5593223.1 glutaminase A [Pseudovibrio sp. SPO723]